MVSAVLYTALGPLLDACGPACSLRQDDLRSRQSESLWTYTFTYSRPSTEFYVGVSMNALTASQIGSCLTWSRTHWFWGDDRCVPHDDGDSNYQMTRAALLSRTPVPDEKIHAVLTWACLPNMLPPLMRRRPSGSTALKSTGSTIRVVWAGTGSSRARH